MRITYGELGRDYRSVMKALPPGRYRYVSAEHDGKRYRVFRLSIWDDDVDGDLTGVLEVPSRSVKDNTVFFLNTSRDLMISLKIRATRGLFYLIEPMPDAQQLVAARLGLTADRYEDLVIKGGLRDLVLHDVEKIRRRYQKTRKTLRSEQAQRASDRERLASDNERLASQASDLLGKLGMAHDDVFVSRNILRAKESEILLLREFIISNGLEVPSRRPRPPWNPG